MSPMSSKLLHKGLALLCVAAVHSGCGVQHAVTSRTDGGSIDLGYGTAKRGSNAFSVSEVQISEAEENVYDDIFGYLRDHVPGVEVSPDAGTGGVPHVREACRTSRSAGSVPFSARMANPFSWWTAWNSPR